VIYGTVYCIDGVVLCDCSSSTQQLCICYVSQ
jgi:hypothetical protein